MLDFLQQYSGAFTFLATLLLVGLTAFYAYLTRGILAATAEQSRLALSPVIGIEIKGIAISEVFGPRRRNMSVSVELSNVGNAPAVEVLIDAEIELRYSNIDGETIIPVRFEPDMVPFIRPGGPASEVSLSFGNRLVTHFFDDVRESQRLNIHRIETDPSSEPHNTSRLRVLSYYRNSLGQNFKSSYESEICLHAPLREDVVPRDDETAEVHQKYIPRPTFHAGLANEGEVGRELEQRNPKRELSGY